jgi:transcription initiation factor TFIID subunit 12
MSAPPAVSTTSESTPVGSPAAGTPGAAATAAAAAAASSSASSPGGGGGGGAPLPSPRTGKPKGKDFSRMAGPPPSTTTTPEIVQPLAPTVPISQPPIQLQSNNIPAALPTATSNFAVGVAGTNNLATSSTTTYPQPSMLSQTQPPQYQPLMSGATMNNFIQQQQQQQQQMIQQQQMMQMQQQQQQQQVIPSSLSMLLNNPALMAPTQRPSWSEARLSTMPDVRGQGVISSSSLMGGVGSTTPNIGSTTTPTTTTTTQRNSMMPPPNDGKKSGTDTTSSNAAATTTTNDGYGKPSLAPILGEKLQSLCHSIDPSYSLDSEVQERLVEMADSFVEKVTKDAIKLAKHRGSSYMDVVDVALALKKGYNLEVPGLGPPSVATAGVGVGGRGSGTVMGGWMFADKVSLGEAQQHGREGNQESSPQKKKRRGATVIATNAM